MKIIKNVLTKSSCAAFPLIRYAVADVKGAGRMLIAVSDEGLCWAGITESVARLRKDFPHSVLMKDDSVRKLAKDVADVWQGKRKIFPLPIVLTGTGFQMLVWSELLKIRRGDTVTYQDIAKKIGKPKAVRAVGSAVGANPVTLLVPCHRVVNKSSAKINYGWGAAVKQKLLENEKGNA